MNLPEPAVQPTMYFVGVSTAKSSIMKLFPLWADRLGLTDAVIKGIDIEIHADPDMYRQCVGFIKNDPLSLGGLVTTHKIDLYHAAHDYFDYIDPYAAMFDEVSSISKKDNRLEAYAKDPISSGLAMEAFIPEGFWRNHQGEVFIMGAGGSALAISSYLTRKDHGDNVPAKIIISNRSQERLISAERLLSRIDTGVKFEYVLSPEADRNDAVLSKLPPHSLVINATGLGKDRPGSPLTDDAIFPRDSLVWELNYRGELHFLRQAERQRSEQGLLVEEGWIYFIHGWTQVIAEVFHISIQGEIFNDLERIANRQRQSD